MSFYSDDALKQLAEGYASVDAKFEALFIRYLSRQFNNPKAREYATHGFPRRLKTLTHSLKAVFRLLPPESDEIPGRDTLSDATVHIQASVFNVFGCVDNLAWIWVFEKGVVRRNGRPLAQTQVGFDSNKLHMRASISGEFRTYLESLEPWFELMSDFRHALAHRIPLYVPPHVVTEKNVEVYRDLEARMDDASRRHDFDEYDRLSVEQMKLVRFMPWMQHSFEENSKYVYFHAQLLANFNTVEELGRKFLEELDR